MHHYNYLRLLSIFSSIEDMNIKDKKEKFGQYSVKLFIEINLYNWQTILLTDY